jgi:small subunit ribosomal protein S8
MMRHDVLSDVMSQIMNAERVGKQETVVKPVSKMVREIIKIMHDAGYLGKFEYIDDNKGGMVKIELVGKINKCGAIRPRFPVKSDAYIDQEKRYLPAREFGMLIVSTPKGIMDHKSASNKGLGGVLLAYVY